MPRNSSGTCTLAEADFIPNTTIVSADMNSDLNDIADMLTDSLSRSGDGGMTANLDMNSHKITELTSGTVPTDAISYAQVQPGSWWVVAGGTANAITATFSPALTAPLADGTIVWVRFAATNTSTTVTLNVNGLGAVNVKKLSGSDLAVGDCRISAEGCLRYNLSATRWELLNPADMGVIGTSAPVNKTAGYTVVNTDNGKTFYFTGGAYYSIAVGAASGFDGNFQCRLINADSRGKLIGINGITNYILWPGQTVTIINKSDSSGWMTDPSPVQRWQPTSAITLHVSTAGSDTNDGLGTGAGNALLTIQQAIYYFRKYFTLNYEAGTIQCANGTYNVGVGIIMAYSQDGASQINIYGNTARNNVIIQVPASTIGIFITDGVICSLSGLTFTATGGGAHALYASNGSMFDLTNGATAATWFDAYATGIHMRLENLSFINVNVSYQVVGDVSVHIKNDFGSYMTYGGATGTIACDLPNALTFTYWYTATSCSTLSSYGSAITFTGAGVAGCVGQKYSVIDNSVANTSGATFPGSIAGVPATGGIYN